MAPHNDRATFRDLSEAEWTWRQEHWQAPAWISGRVPAQLPDDSPEAHDAAAARWTDTLGTLKSMEFTAWPAAERADYGVYRHQIESLVADEHFRVWRAPCNSDTTIWQSLLGLRRLRLGSADDTAKYEQLLADMPRYLAQQVANLKTGLREGFAPPRVTMAGREGPAASIAKAGSAHATGFLNPLAEAGAPTDSATRLIEAEVIPAFSHLATFLQDDYLPNLPRVISAQERYGEDFYQAQLAKYATTGHTGPEIHRIGLDEVERLESEMARVAGEAGFASAEKMLDYMRTDRSFYVTDPQQLLNRAAWICKEFDRVAPSYFGYLPRARFGIIEPDPEVAPYYTTARGGFGVYVLNTYALDQRPLHSLPALTLHEAAPGHAFQIPFAREMRHLPEFRRESYISAYGEGWALYTETLGVEMGMYHDEFELMGMLSHQMWRAARLVIDPGIHALGWSRERAIEFLAKHTAIGPHEVETEVDRYISWPGQATSYYLGKMQLEHVLKAARHALGSAFSYPAFHDAVLSLGCVPLPVLSDQIEEWIANGGVSPLQDRL